VIEALRTSILVPHDHLHIKQKSASGHAKYAVTYMESGWVLTATRVAAGSRMQIGVFRAASGRSRCDPAVFYSPAQMQRITGKSA
jgi:hypothetical protein